MALGQDSGKKVKYADAQGVYISEKKFNECLMAGYPTKTIVEDGITVNFLSQNFIEDKLTQTENEQVRLILEKIVGKDIDRNKAIAIHLYKKMIKSYSTILNTRDIGDRLKETRTELKVI